MKVCKLGRGWAGAGQRLGRGWAGRAGQWEPPSSRWVAQQRGALTTKQEPFPLGAHTYACFPVHATLTSSDCTVARSVHQQLRNSRSHLLLAATPEARGQRPAANSQEPGAISQGLSAGTLSFKVSAWGCCGQGREPGHISCPLLATAAPRASTAQPRALS
jgi:hypothetical protein